MDKSYILSQYGRIFNPPNWYYNPSHLTNRIYYIVSGTAFFQDKTPLYPGHFYIFKASPAFKVCQDPNDPVDHIFFDFITSGTLINQDIIDIPAKDHPHLNYLSRLIGDELDGKKCPWNIGQAYFNILTHELDEYLVEEKLYSPLTSRVLKAIHSLSPDKMNVNEIALMLNMNENHIIRTFKNETGTTPHKYINQIKANLAISYLQQGLLLEEIAEKLGFSSVSSLCVFFKTTTKRTLTYYKR